MKRTFIITLIVLIVALCACTAGLLTLKETTDEARRLKNEAVLAVESEEYTRAKELMVQLAQLWRDREPIMEMLTSHDAIHEVKTGIIEAQICLECEDHDDFLRTISIVGEGLEHMNATEALSFTNLS